MRRAAALLVVVIVVAIAAGGVGLARIHVAHLADDCLQRLLWTDPDGYENVNIVATAAKPLISALSAQLRAAFAIV